MGVRLLLGVIALSLLFVGGLLIGRAGEEGGPAGAEKRKPRIVGLTGVPSPKPSLPPPSRGPVETATPPAEEGSEAYPGEPIAGSGGGASAEGSDGSGAEAGDGDTTQQPPPERSGGGAEPAEGDSTPKPPIDEGGEQ
ncbi:MAG TPA: hypothetical protein VF729_00650 [Solirubrobacterales bacterium]